jgi:hypothetical protein
MLTSNIFIERRWPSIRYDGPLSESSICKRARSDAKLALLRPLQPRTDTIKAIEHSPGEYSTTG